MRGACVVSLKRLTETDVTFPAVTVSKSPLAFFPMLVRYSGHYTLNDLEMGRLAVSKVTSFNDPFELHLMPGEQATLDEAVMLMQRMMDVHKEYAALVKQHYPTIDVTDINNSPREIREELAFMYIERTPAVTERIKKYVVAMFDRKGRVICFAKPLPRSPLEIPMWGYYGDGHKGVRIHASQYFLADKRFRWRQIQYRESPPKLDYKQPPIRLREAVTFYQMVLDSKSTAWAHEGETRLSVAVRHIVTEADSKGVPRDFIRIKPEYITRIDLGMRCDDATVNHAERLKGKYPHLEIYAAEKSEDTYGIRYIELR